MAYVVARPKGRFEIRESVHTPNGPRARTLANFATLDDDVLETAGQRARRPFDAAAVRASARRASVRRTGAARPRADASHGDARQFVEASRRMAASLETRPAPGRGEARDPGDVLLELLAFADEVRAHLPRRTRPEPLGFPPLARMAESTKQAKEKQAKEAAKASRAEARAAQGPR